MTHGWIFDETGGLSVSVFSKEAGLRCCPSCFDDGDGKRYWAISGVGT